MIPGTACPAGWHETDTPWDVSGAAPRGHAARPLGPGLSSAHLSTPRPLGSWEEEQE